MVSIATNSLASSTAGHCKSNEKKSGRKMPKSTEGTVFVRFSPTPSQKLRRAQLEDIFSEIGPIKKTSWIQSENNSSKGYGFVKYLSDDDAKTASTSLNGTKIEMDGVEYRILVELASLQQGQQPAPRKSSVPKAMKATEEEKEDAKLPEEVTEELLKKKSRVIIRNLSFYAKENEIRKVVERKFGKVVDVHLPQVQSNLHVGFCFVTFADPKVAQKAVEAESIDIHKRTASIAWSLPKKVHQQMQESGNNATKKEETSEAPVDESADKADEDDADNDSPDSDSASEDDNDDAEEEDEKVNGHSAALEEGRTVFLRNLPFDTTRKDLFEIFAKFGYIESIYLVKDKETDLLKGTAFITYKRAKSAETAVSRASSKSTSEQLTDKESGEPLLLKGRKILVDMAVDKETAETFDSKEHNMPSADRRNMYLQSEARVESTPTDPSMDRSNTWEELPESDQKKRQSALKDKTTKLQSPIFFINPNRLSLRNLAKHVDEIQLRTLCEQATKKGLQAGLVGAKDLIAHLRAQGELSTREILELVQGKSKSEDDILPPWDDTKKSKDYIPSVYIDREFGARDSKSTAASRGFGFVEFTHHVHALACLRELNNNPAYSREYAAGGKAAVDLKRKGRKHASKGGGDVRIPRLIVDFTVENRVKAKKQMERRLHQKLNNEKQRKGAAEVDVTGAPSKKRGRGAVQRAKKKQKKDNGGEGGNITERNASEAGRETPNKTRVVNEKTSRKNNKQEGKRDAPPNSKPPVGSHSKDKVDTTEANPRPAKNPKRWFEQ